MNEIRSVQPQGSEEEWRRLAAQLYVEQCFQARTAAEQNSQTYGGMAIRGLSLLNGGAIIALLAFVGSVYEGRPGDFGAGTLIGNLFLPVVLYLAGLVLAPIASAVAYANWQLIATQLQGPGDLYRWMVADPEQQGIEENAGLVKMTAFAALALGFLSLAFFCAATLVATWAITSSVPGG